MARVLITGSSDGLGSMAAELLVHVGHAVTLHARNDQRAGDARRALPAAEQVVVGDLASIEATRQVAEQTSRFPTRCNSYRSCQSDQPQVVVVQ